MLLFLSKYCCYSNTCKRLIAIFFFKNPKGFLWVILLFVTFSLSPVEFILQPTRRANRLEWESVSCERLLSSTPIRCLSCGVWARTTRRAIETPWSFGGWALNRGSPETAVSLGWTAARVAVIDSPGKHFTAPPVKWGVSRVQRW